MPNIEMTEKTFEECDYHEVLEAFSGQSHLVQIGHWSNATQDYYRVTVNALPEGYYSFTETENYTTKTPFMLDGREVGTQVRHNLGTEIHSEAFDDLGEALSAAFVLITKFAAERATIGA